MKNTRRTFLKAVFAAGSASLFNIVPAHVLGANAPSKKIVMGMIGLGYMGARAGVPGAAAGNMAGFLSMDDVVVKAVCDVYRPRMEHAKKIVDDKYGNADCEMISDFRLLCERKDIDALMLAVPDHWHGAMSVYALSHGKDVYGEKPFSHDLREGRAIVNAVNRYSRVWQTGSWQRSSPEMRRGVELVRNGRIGKVVRMVVGLPGGGGGPEPVPGAKVPEGLDWNMWLGPAPWRPYQGVYDFHWRWVLDWGGGNLMDWIGHHGDIAQWGIGRDATGPVTYEGTADFTPSGIYDSPKSYRFDCEYADGVKLTVSDTDQLPPLSEGIPWQNGTQWIGENGDWVHVQRGRYHASSPKIFNSRIEAGEWRVESPGHFRDFIDAVKTRDTTLAHAEVAHRSASLGHLGYIAMRTGRKIRWDPDKEKLIGDSQASTLLGRVPRGPWTLV